MTGALGGVGKESNSGIHAEGLGSNSGLVGDLSQLIGSSADNITFLVQSVFVGDIQTAVSKALHIIILDEDEAGGTHGVAGSGFKKLQCSTDSVSGGVHCAAEVSINHTGLQQHGAEVVGLHEGGACLVLSELAVTSLDHNLDHDVNMLILMGVDNFNASDIAACSDSSAFDDLLIADKNGAQNTLISQAACSLNDTCIGALCKGDGTILTFKYANKILKHFSILQKWPVF